MSSSVYQPYVVYLLGLKPVFLVCSNIFNFSPGSSPTYSSSSPGQALPSVAEDDLKEEDEEGNKKYKEQTIMFFSFQTSRPPHL